MFGGVLDMAVLSDAEVLIITQNAHAVKFDHLVKLALISIFPIVTASNLDKLVDRSNRRRSMITSSRD